MNILLSILLQTLLPFQMLGTYLDSIQQNSNFKNAIIATAVQNTKTKEIIFQYQAEKAVNSASTLKLITTGCALSVLGTNYQYQTYIEYDGDLIGNELHGNIYIRGSGDPSLGSSRIGTDYSSITKMFAKAIYDFGIRKVNGYVIGDASFFNEKSIADSWIWGDMGNYYGAGVSGLNFNENLFQVSFKPSSLVGEPAQVLDILPKLSEWEIENRVTTAERNSGDQVNIYSSPLGNKIILTGTVPTGTQKFMVKGAIHHSDYLVAQLVKNELISMGVDSTLSAIPFSQYKQKFGYYPKRKNIIFTYNSPILSELVKHCNHQSVNLYADSFLKTCGVRLANDSNYENAILAIKQLLAQQGADLQGFMIRDGSGLSPSGVLTANNMVGILSIFAQQSFFNEFYQSIPIVGVSGTVKHLAKNSKAHGNMHAKSGSISNTRAYAGYFTSKNGDLMSFMAVINRYADEADALAKKALEELMIRMMEL